jgi:hypothetical protein
MSTITVYAQTLHMMMSVHSPRLYFGHFRILNEINDMKQHASFFEGCESGPISASQIKVTEMLTHKGKIKKNNSKIIFRLDWENP